MKHNFKQPNRRHSLLNPILTFFLFVLSLPQTMFAQDDRVNHAIPVIGDTALWTIKKATGWMKNEEGQWLEGKNKIQKYRMSVNNKPEWETGLNAVGKDNFIKLEARSITIGGIELLLILKYTKDGNFETPVLEKGWKPTETIKYYVVKKHVTSAKDYDDKSDYKTFEMKLYFNGYVENTPDALKKIASAIAAVDEGEPRYKEVGSNASIMFYYGDLKDGKPCRFFIRMNKGGAQPYDTFPRQPEMEYSSPWVRPLEHYYYECPKANMAGLITLITKK